MLERVVKYCLQALVALFAVYVLHFLAFDFMGGVEYDMKFWWLLAALYVAARLAKDYFFGEEENVSDK